MNLGSTGSSIPVKAAKLLAAAFLGSFWLVTPVSAGPVLSGNVSFTLEDNRVYADLPFLTPDGNIRKAWTFVDIGTPHPVVSSALYRALKVAEQEKIVFQIGDLSVEIPSNELVKSDWFYGFREKTEFILPGSVMQRFEVAIDYSKRRLTFARPGTIATEGIAVPCRVNRDSGLISVEVSVDNRAYNVAVDNGSAYTWFSDRISQAWTRKHPDWQRGVGAVGEANMQMMTDWSFLFMQLPSSLRSFRIASLKLRYSEPDREASGIILRLPEVRVGTLQLYNVGALAVSDVFGWYSKKTAEPVVGWLGGNVLKNFRLTIDFSNHMTYWKQQRALDPYDLDQVGLTLLALGDDYFIAGISSVDRQPTVAGIQRGDQLIEVNGVKVTGASRDAVLSALRGKVGDIRDIVVSRSGKELTVQAKVIRF